MSKVHVARPAVALVFAGGMILAGVGSTYADSADCTGFGSLNDGPAPSSGRIAPGTGRTAFVRNGSDLKTCPNATAACRAKAFLVPGDAVIVGATHGDFICVDYIGAKGADRAGWIPIASVTHDPAPSSIGRDDWTGTWLREEATITVTSATRAGALSIHGDATYGAEDPERVKRGAVNVGAIEATMAPTGANLSFAMGDTATLPVDKGADTDCKVWMRRLGPYLLVDDNNQCGGMNVSFRGAYVRKG